MPQAGHDTPAAAAAGPPAWVLGALAVAADLAWRALALAPWAFFLLLGALWWQQPWAAWLAVAVLLLLGWALMPLQPLAGEPITRAQAPGLFARLDEIQRQLDCRPVAQVLLGSEFNAGVVDGGARRWPRRVRHSLVIGVPLLAVLNEAQARAVLAHELGHLSRRHGSLGQWVYRARLGWLALQQAPPGDGSAFDRLVSWFARRFAPWFSRLAFAHSRRCEYEADADAARLVSPADVVAALALLRVAEGRMQAWRHHVYPGLLSQRADAMVLGWHEHLPALLARAPDAGERAAAWGRPPGANDTHPSLPQRAAALGLAGPETLALPALAPGHCAGAAWLADWPGALAGCAQRAMAAMHWCTLARHLWLARLRAWLDGQARPAGLPASLAHAEALQQLGQPGPALAMLEALAALGGADPQRDHALALAWLAQPGAPAARVAAALALLEAAVQAEPALAWSARAAALAEAQAQADGPAMQHLAARLSRAGERRAQALQQAHACIESAGLAPPRLPAHALSALDDLCAQLPGVLQAWSGHAPVASRDGRRFDAHVLVLQVDPAALQAAGLLDDDLSDAALTLLQAARPMAGDLVLARISFSTERALPEVLARSAARHWPGGARAEIQVAEPGG
ncbi:M48 family metalloprotease [Aquabacterium sp. OR-4]|uniref:M48 family metalloprotease n=1 Tax=Aquabacterium sp. OR-4 TaxID=2978127 RepID=UPI0021B1D598|nr:M48 family metallopeptidase [Aquabacterium sp. OR-4]MDT7836865.1 M48 family metalloprotease [Aquabacterium sp. OR-4]